MKTIKVTIHDVVLVDGINFEEKDFTVEVPYSEEMLKWAKERSVDSNIEIVEREYPVERPSQFDVIEAQVTYTAMMTDTLLEV